MQRIWRLVCDAAAKGSEVGASAPSEMDSEAEDLRRATHKTIAGVTNALQKLRFNSAVAQVYELANTLSASLQAAGAQPKDDVRFALREAAEAFARVSAPMVPHLAEECWALLGHKTLVAEEPWPEADQALLTEDTVTIAVQVNGRRRDELTIARDASKEDIEAAALKLENVERAIEGRKIKKVVVVPWRIVNVVA